MKQGVGGEQGGKGVQWAQRGTGVGKEGQLGAWRNVA